MTLEHIRVEKRSLNLHNDDKRTGDLKTTCNLTSGKFSLRSLMTFFLILILYVPKYGRQKVIDVFLLSCSLDVLTLLNCLSRKDRINLSTSDCGKQFLAKILLILRISL